MKAATTAEETAKKLQNVVAEKVSNRFALSFSFFLLGVSYTRVSRGTVSPVQKCLLVCFIDTTDHSKVFTLLIDFFVLL